MALLEPNVAGSYGQLERSHEPSRPGRAAEPIGAVLICPAISDRSILEAWLTDESFAPVLWVARILQTEGEKFGLHGSPCLVIRMDGDHLQIALGPRSDACPGCLELRAIPLRKPGEIGAYYAGRSVNSSSRPFLTEFARLSILELIARLRSEAASPTFGYELHLPTLRVHQFHVERHPDCPICAHPADDSADAILLFSRQKREIGKYRSTEPSQIGLRFQAYLNSTCGMFGSGAAYWRYHQLDVGVAGSFYDPGPRPVKMAWSGRQRTYRSSLAVGILEAFERYAGLKMRSRRPAVFDCYRDVRDSALDPRECGIYEPLSCERDSNLTAFSEDLRIWWTWGYSLTERRPILVPLQMVYYGDASAKESKFVYENSNGCATGSCLEEALFFGLLERIERDAFLIYWYARLSPPQINPESLSNPDLLLAIERLRRQSLDVHLLDTRLDLCVPSVVAVLTRPDSAFGAFAVAAACDFDPEVALLSALSEAASRQIGFQARTRAHAARLRAAFNDFALVRTMRDHADFYGLPESLEYARFLIDSPVQRTAAAAYSDWNRMKPATLDLLDDLDACIRFLKSAGLEQVVVVDQTTPEQLRVGLRTVRVLVPGMIPLDFGYGRCRAATLPRLSAVPAKLGLRGRQLAPEDLNRAPHPFA